MNVSAFISRQMPWLLSLMLAGSALAQPAVSVAVVDRQISGSGSAVIALAAMGVENNITFTLSWDPAVLQYVGDVKGAAVASYLPNRSQTGAGKLSVLAAASPNATFPAGTNPLVTVNFTAIASSAGTAISMIDGSVLTPSLARKRVFDVQGENLATATFEDANIAVSKN